MTSFDAQVQKTSVPGIIPLITPTGVSTIKRKSLHRKRHSSRHCFLQERRLCTRRSIQERDGVVGSWQSKMPRPSIERECGTMHSAALVRILATGKRLRKDSRSDLGLSVPFGRAFGLPCPVKPPRLGRVGIHLGLNVSPDISFLIVGKGADTGVETLTTANSRATIESAVIAGAFVSSIQIFRTVRRCPRR